MHLLISRGLWPLEKQQLSFLEAACLWAHPSAHLLKDSPELCFLQSSLHVLTVVGSEAMAYTSEKAGCSTCPFPMGLAPSVRDQLCQVGSAARHLSAICLLKIPFPLDAEFSHMETKFSPSAQYRSLVINH